MVYASMPAPAPHLRLPREGRVLEVTRAGAADARHARAGDAHARTVAHLRYCDRHELGRCRWS